MIESSLSENEFHTDVITDAKRIGGFSEKVNNDAGNGRKPDRIRFVTFVTAADLSDFDQLSLQMINRSTIHVLVEMILTGVSKATGKDCLRLFSGGRETLLPGQKRRLRFPAEGFGFYGQSRNWKHVSRIEIICKKEKYDESSEPFNVVLSPLYGERRHIPSGPRLTAEGLFQQLHRHVPGEIFSETHTEPMKIFTPPYGDPEESADRILTGNIMGQKLSFPLSWNFSPDGAHEWTHFLNRHHFLRPVLQAFINTRKPVYSEFIENVLCDWIRKNPVPIGSNGGSGPSWETLSVAWRIREWLEITQVLWNVWNENVQRWILRSFWEHCHHLMDHRGHPNNWIILESGALALTGMKLPVFKGAALWREEGLSRLCHETRRQFMADGVHFECSPLYHALCLHVLLDVKKTAEKLKIWLPAEFHTTIRKAAGYLGAICRPDFTWPSLNDSGGVSGSYAAMMHLFGEMEKRPDFIWLGTKGEKGTPPDKTMSVFGSAGIAAMRSGWQKSAHALVFRAGPPGMSHVHEDVLSLDISVSGVPCLVDPGITAYAPGRLSEWYRSAAAHNMILIDNEGPVRSGLSYRQRIMPAERDFFFYATETRQFVQGVCRYGRENNAGAAITVRRQAAPLDNGGWCIKDSIDGDGRHDVTVCWQFFPGQVKYCFKTHTACYENDAGQGCILKLWPAGHIPAVRHSFGSHNPPAGWISVHGRNVPADHLQFSFSVFPPLLLTWEIRPYESGKHRR